MRIGFIGLGIMGSRMAANFRAKGHELWVYNRTRDARAAAAGAAGATGPRRRARWRTTPGIELHLHLRRRSARDGGDRLRRAGLHRRAGAGTRVVDFSTMFPALMRRLGAAIAERGGALLEAPMTGSKNAAQAGTLLLMCGGERALFDELQPVLGAVSAKAIYVGALGQATQVKLIGNVMIAHMVEALSEGAALAARSDIPLSKLLEVVQSSGYASPFWDFKGKALMERDFSTHFSVDLMHKDLSLALATAHEKKVPMPGDRRDPRGLPAGARAGARAATTSRRRRR